jgi:C4-dicarboxylate transporter DctM subunit
VGFIIYASLANVSVVRLFLAGAVPGVIMGIYMMVVCYIITRRKNLTAGEKTSLIKVSIAFKQAFWALLMPIIILGGIIASIVTPTEAGVLAVIYGLVVGIFIYRTIKLQDIPYLLAKSAKQTAVLMFIITVAQAFGWILSRQGAPEILMNLFSDISPHRWVFLLILNFVIIFLGCFMEGGSIMIILTPLLLPTLKKYGVDLVHFGVVFQLNIMIGLLTPPVGMLLFVISSISGVQVNKMFGNLWPFFIAILIVLFLVTFFPHITLFLPNILA